MVDFNSDVGNAFTTVDNPDLPSMADAAMPLTAPGQLEADKRTYSVGEHMAMAVPGVTFSVLDTIGRSLSFGLIPEETMSNFLNSASPVMGDYYSSNKSALQTAGDIATFLIPGTLGAKAMTSGSWLYRGLQSTTGLSSDSAILRGLFATAGGEAAIAGGVARSDLASAAARSLDFTVANPVRQQLVTEAYKTVALDAVKKYAGSEVATYMTMNQSEFLYPSDMSLVGQLAFHGLGLGGSVALDSLFLRNAMKNSLLSPEITGQIRKSINSLDSVLDNGAANAHDYSVTTWAMTAAEQKATAASTIGSDEAAVALRSNANKYATVAEERMMASTEKLLADKIPWAASNQANNPLALESLTSALKQNPTALVGAAGVEALPYTADELAARVVAHSTFMSESATRVDKLNENINKILAKEAKMNAKGVELSPFAEQQKANRLFNAQKEIDDLTVKQEQFNSLTPVVVEPTGQVIPAGRRAIQFHDLPNPPAFQVINKTTTNAKELRLSVENPNTGNRFAFGLSDDLVLALPQGSSWNNLDRFEQSTLYAAGQKLVNDYKPGRGVLNRIPLNDKSSPFQLDIASAIVKKYPEAAADFSVPSASIKDVGSWLEEMSVRKKYDDIFVPAMDKYAQKNTMDLLAPTLEQSQAMENLRYSLNLGTTREGTQSPLFNVFQSFYFQGNRTLDSALTKFSDLQGIMKGAMFPLGGAGENGIQPEVMAFMRDGNIPVTGDNLAVPMSKTGTGFLPAQLAWIRAEPFDITKNGMLKYATGVKMEKLDKLSQAPGLVGDVASQIASNSAYQYAKQVETLAAGMERSTGALTYQNITTRGIPVFTALDMTSNIAEKAAQQKIKDTFAAHNPNFMALRATGAEGDMFQFSEFAQMRRAGFDLLDTPVQMPDGSTAFKLRSVLNKNGGETLTAKNAAALERIGFDPKTYATHVVDGEDLGFLMPRFNTDGTAAPLTVGPKALAGINSISAIYKDLWDGSNFFRTYYGSSPLGFQNFYMPPENLGKKFIKYIVSPGENGVGTVKQLVTGNTPGEVEAKLKQVLDLMPSPERATVIDQNSMARWFNLHDEAFFNMVDMSDGVRQTGKMGGRLFQRQTEYGTQVLNDMVKAAENMIGMQAKRTLSVLYEDQLQYARMAHSTVAPQGDTAAPSIYKQYVARALGVNPANYQTHFTFSDEEHLLDRMLSGFTDKLNSSSSRAAGAAKDYEALKAQLGDALPYTNATDFAANTFKVQPPKDLHSMASALNSTTVNLTLRVGEAANGLMAVLGNLVSMPLVMNMMKRQSYDTDESFLARTGLFGMDIGHKDYAMPNPARMMAKAVGMLFKEEGQNILAEAKAIGNISPHVYDAAVQYHKPFETYTQRSIRRFIDAASIPSDAPEMLSRSWAYLAGYNIAKDGYYVANSADRHAIANLFADNVIANYRAVNKPTVFTGITGSALGMFQSYMYNYWGRMFQYIENKDYRSMAMAYAMQGTMFGMKSVPGWEQFQSMYAWAHDGNKDVVDALDSKYGRQVSDVLLNGTISNISRIFSNDGMALWSRGDVGINRIPAFIDPTNAPIFNLGSNSAKLVGAMIDQFRSGGQPSGQRTLEALGAYTVNRPFSRIMELMAGTAVDGHGNLINADTRTAWSGVSRMLGMRPLIEAKAIETNARVAAQTAANQEKHDRLTDTLKAIFRGNPSQETIDNTIAKASMDYLQAGGSPAGVAGFIRNAAIQAHITKQDKKLLDLLNNPSRTNDIMRLVTNMTSYQE